MKLPGEMKRCPYCGSEPMSMASIARDDISEDSYLWGCSNHECPNRNCVYTEEQWERRVSWIKVEDELPPRMEDVFIRYDYGVGYGLLYNDDGEIRWSLDFDASGNEVIEWMPIPEE